MEFKSNKEFKKRILEQSEKTDNDIFDSINEHLLKIDFSELRRCDISYKNIAHAVDEYKDYYAFVKYNNTGEICLPVLDMESWKSIDSVNSIYLTPFNIYYRLSKIKPLLEFDRTRYKELYNMLRPNYVRDKNYHEKIDEFNTIVDDILSKREVLYVKKHVEVSNAIITEAGINLLKYLEA